MEQPLGRSATVNTWKRVVTCILSFVIVLGSIHIIFVRLGGLIQGHFPKSIFATSPFINLNPPPPQSIYPYPFLPEFIHPTCQSMPFDRQVISKICFFVASVFVALIAYSIRRKYFLIPASKVKRGERKLLIWANSSKIFTKNIYHFQPMPFLHLQGPILC